jgi:hypothetical protein
MARVVIEVPIEVRGRGERILQWVRVAIGADQVERALESGTLRLERQTVVLASPAHREPVE